MNNLLFPPFLLSARTALGFGALDNPGGWSAPSLLQIPEDAMKDAVVTVQEPPLMQEIRAGAVAEPPKGLWAASRTHKESEPAPLSEAAQLVTEIFEESLAQLQRADSFAKLERAWQNLKETFFMPSDDLPDAQKKIGEWLGIFSGKISDMARLRNGLFLRAFEFYRQMLQTVAEPKSVGKVVQRCLRETSESGWGKSLLEHHAALKRFLQKSVDEKWEAKDRELVLSIWNEPITAVGEAAIARVAARAILIVETVDINDLEAVQTAQTVFNLWSQSIAPETVGARFQLDAETRTRLAPKIEAMRCRAIASESRWDPSWRADADLPQTADGFFTLNVYGQAVTLTVEGLALLSTPELDKRFSDIRTTPENKSQVAWAYLKEKLVEPGQQEALPELLKNLQLAIVVKWAAGMNVAEKVPGYFLSPDETLDEVETILEGSLYYTARVGDESVYFSSENFRKISGGEHRTFVRPSGFRRFSSKDKRTFQKKKLSDAEKNYFTGLHELVSLGEGVVEILKGLDRFRWTMEPPAWVGIYEEIVAAVGVGTLPPSEGVMRLLKLRQNEARGSMKELDWRQMDPIFREPVDPQVRSQLVSKVFGEDLLTRVIVGERLPSAAKLRGILDAYIRVGLPQAGVDVSSLRVIAGDLLEFGRKASPYDDRYSAVEFRQLVLLHQMAFQEMKKSWNPVALFKREAAGVGEPFRRLSVLQGAILLHPQMPTHVDLAKVVREKLKIGELDPSLLKEDRARRAIEEACWVEVCVAVIKNFRRAVRGEAYDKDLLDALVNVYGRLPLLNLEDRRRAREKLLHGGSLISIGGEEFIKTSSSSELALLLKNYRSWVTLEDVLLPARLFGEEELSPTDRHLHQIYNLLVCLLGDTYHSGGIPSLDINVPIRMIAHKLGISTSE